MSLDQAVAPDTCGDIGRPKRCVDVDWIASASMYTDVSINIVFHIKKVTIFLYTSEIEGMQVSSMFGSHKRHTMNEKSLPANKWHA